MGQVMLLMVFTALFLILPVMGLLPSHPTGRPIVFRTRRRFTE
jgi:hypothetical protein